MTLTLYFEGLENAVLLNRLTNKDVDYIEIMTNRNLTSEEIADMDIYKYGKDYINTHKPLVTDENNELVKNVVEEFKAKIISQAEERIAERILIISKGKFCLLLVYQALEKAVVLLVNF